ncbi:hypothetical protein [Neobacillus mesonae]|uniref:hypothetical protein n=1 Tax=Neobacillus mesonae TaxID=1193713 RepID=UPI00203FD3AE|nr:hypothetical protein [Neobacillus mesonae]MCM3570613.1 hypothetical protein [Neobacillus mesonae]
MFKFISALLGASVLANIILGFLYLGQKTITAQAGEKNEEIHKQMVQLKNETKKSEKELNTFQQNKAYYEIEHSEEIKSFVDDTFRKLFNYDNKNYVERFDQVQDRLAASVMSKLKASGENGSTQIEFKNEVKAVSVYLSAVGNDRAKALVNMETQYAVGGSEFPRKNQMYEVTLAKDGSKWLVDKLELMGSFEPFEGS